MAEIKPINSPRILMFKLVEKHSQIDWVSTFMLIPFTTLLDRLVLLKFWLHGPKTKDMDYSCLNPQDLTTGTIVVHLEREDRQLKQPLKRLILAS